MREENKSIDPLPDEFESDAAAGEFWDTHSLADYEEHLEAADDVTIEISERMLEVRLAEDVFKKLQQEASSLGQPANKIVDKILRRQLIDRYSERTSSGGPYIPLWLLLGMFPVAGVLFWLAEKVPHWLVATTAHTAEALMVAAIIGLTYEFFVHKRRERALREMLWEHQEKTYDAIQAYGKTTPKEVFSLLEDIARQTRKMPTLYRPPRVKDDEYTFAERCDFFEKIISVQGTDVVEILKKWTAAKHPHLRFLASDFIGRYELRKLKEDLLKYAKPNLEPTKWQTLSKEEKQCTLNYVWAASRCERPRYKGLREVLMNPPNRDPMVPNWILFVPQQMPEDHEFLEIIEEYLERKPAIDAPSLELVKQSLLALESQHPGEGNKLLKRFSQLFSEVDAEATRD